MVGSVFRRAQPPFPVEALGHGRVLLGTILVVGPPVCPRISPGVDLLDLPNGPIPDPLADHADVVAGMTVAKITASMSYLASISS